MSIHKPHKNITLTRLQEMKASNEKIACLTAYDASFAAILDQVGMDVILVGDSLGMVVQGQDSTVSVTMEDMIYHSQCVSAAVKHAFVIADMPFMSYTNVEQALANATDLIQLGGAQMVKLEASSRQVSIVQELSECGIPICAHLGLRPQYIHKLGGYAMQGKDDESAKEACSKRTKFANSRGRYAVTRVCAGCVGKKNYTRVIYTRYRNWSGKRM